MSIKVMTMVFAAHFGNVSLKAVALKMADHAGDDGGSIYPAKETIAVATEVSVATVKRSLRLFVRKGLLSVVRAGGKGPGDATVYAFNLDLLQRMSNETRPLSAFPDYEPPAVGNDPAEDVGSDDDKGVMVNPLEDAGSDDKGITVNPIKPNNGGHGDPPTETVRGSLEDAKGVTGDQNGGQSLTPKPSRTVKEPCSRACERAGPPDDTPIDDERLRAVLLEAVGQSADPDARQLDELVIPRRWLSDGAELDRDIVPALRARAAAMEPGRLRSWQYMDGPVADWVDKRRRSRPSVPCQPANPRDLSKLTDRQWRYWLNHWLNGGVWANGPMPDDAGCVVPAHLLAEFRHCRGDEVFERRKRWRSGCVFEPAHAVQTRAGAGADGNGAPQCHVESHAGDIRNQGKGFVGSCKRRDESVGAKCGEDDYPRGPGEAV